ncbi:hypothetical protein [Vibrio phage BONAISHI]|nr:hypothetical protein [Vibrio phage BONAISHI]
MGESYIFALVETIKDTVFIITRDRIEDFINASADPDSLKRKINVFTGNSHSILETNEDPEILKQTLTEVFDNGDLFHTALPEDANGIRQWAKCCQEEYVMLHSMANYSLVKIGEEYKNLHVIQENQRKNSGMGKALLIVDDQIDPEVWKKNHEWIAHPLRQHHNEEIGIRLFVADDELALKRYMETLGITLDPETSALKAVVLIADNGFWRKAQPEDSLLQLENEAWYLEESYIVSVMHDLRNEINSETAPAGIDLSLPLEDDEEKPEPIVGVTTHDRGKFTQSFGAIFPSPGQHFFDATGYCYQLNTLGKPVKLIGVDEEWSKISNEDGSVHYIIPESVKEMEDYEYLLSTKGTAIAVNRNKLINGIFLPVVELDEVQYTLKCVSLN